MIETHGVGSFIAEEGGASPHIEGFRGEGINCLAAKGDQLAAASTLKDEGEAIAIVGGRARAPVDGARPFIDDERLVSFGAIVGLLHLDVDDVA